MGEKALLELAMEICDKGDRVRLGIGDDAAVYETEDGLIVITTDMLVENVHFTEDFSAENLGRKAVVVNLSDLAAMGAEPYGLVYSFGTPSKTKSEYVSNLLENINSTARSYDSYILGGDMNEAGEVIISGTAFGGIEEGELLSRSGAGPGDIIGVTGSLGAASAGFEVMISDDYSLDDWKILEKGLYRPKARIKEGRILAQSNIVTSAIDITDGLACDLWQVSRMSQVSLEIDASALPVDSEVERFAEETDSNLDEFLLYGGEDFELLFTVESGQWNRLEKMFEDIDTSISRIGRVSSGEGVFINREEGREKVPDKGYEHFK